MPPLSRLLILGILTGCAKSELPAVASVTIRVYTVTELLSQPDLRRKVSAECNNDPGRIGQSPNCINVRNADRIAAAGSMASMPRIVP